MKATGIVRRIDDLGRVVIPKEIRRTMRIREGDPLEIYTDRDGEVIFKKYSPMGELSTFVSQLCDTVSKTTGYCFAVCDRDAVIAASGACKKDLIDKAISDEIEKVMEDRIIYRQNTGDAPVYLCQGVENSRVVIAAPIITEGDVSGCAMFIDWDGNTTPGDSEYKLAQTIAVFLGKQMEG